MRVCRVVAIGVLCCTGCPADDPEPQGGSESTSTGEDPTTITTVPLTTGADDDAPTTAADTTMGGATGETTEGSTSSGSGGSTTDSTTGSDSDGGSSTGVVAAEVGWCILQFPASIEAAPDEATTIYARVFVEGITDQSQFVDEDPLVVAEFGYGADGSTPDEAWTWTEGTPNPGWDGTMAQGGFGNENNDEYQADVAFGAAGTYDYAARFSADGGTTWAYCDLNDLKTGGYTPDQAGDAVIQ